IPLCHLTLCNRVHECLPCLLRTPPRSSLFPYPTLFRSRTVATPGRCSSQLSATCGTGRSVSSATASSASVTRYRRSASTGGANRSEEHTSELQSREKLVCRRLLEKKNNK